MSSPTLSPTPSPAPNPKTNPTKKSLQYVQTAEAVKIHSDAIETIRAFLEVHPLLQHPKRETESEEQSWGYNDKFGATILPLAQQNEYMNDKSPAWPQFIKFYEAIAPYILQASTVLAQEYPQIYHIARHITSSQSTSSSLSILHPTFWTTQKAIHGRPYDTCFTTLRLTANISYTPIPFLSSHPIGPLAIIIPLGFWLDGGGNLVISRPGRKKPLVLKATEGALHVEFCESKVGVEGFEGERYMLELFLPEFDFSGCEGGLRGVLEGMPKEVRSVVGEGEEETREAVEAWLEERLRWEDEGMEESDSKLTPALLRKGKEVAVKLEREDDSMDSDWKPAPATSSRKRKEGAINLENRSSKRLKSSSKTPTKTQGLNGHDNTSTPSKTTKPRRAATITKVKREESVEDPTEIWCFCKGPAGDRPMIGCDDENCRHQWFHISCVGLDKKRLPDKWYCPECTEVRGAAAINKPTMSQTWKNEDTEMS